VDDEPSHRVAVEFDDQIAVLEAQARERRHFYLDGGDGAVCEGSVRYLLQKKL
jgi:hypothetical protein